MGRGENLLYDPPVIRKGKGGLEIVREIVLSEKPLDLSWDGERIMFASRKGLHLVKDDGKEESVSLGEQLGFSRDGAISLNSKSGDLVLALILKAGISFLLPFFRKMILMQLIVLSGKKD